MRIFPKNTWILAAGLTGLALPVAAQEVCGGTGQWIGGGEAASDIATADSFREQMALVLSGNEYVPVFSLSEATSVRIEAAGRGNGDPLIELLDADGTMILTDDDSGGNGAARAEVALNPGTYCMSLISYDGAPMTAFVRIGRTEQEALTEGVSEEVAVVAPEDTAETVSDPTGSCGDAPSMGTLDGPLTTSSSVDDNSFWRFTLASDAAISITAENEDADPVIALFDSAEIFIDENDDFDGLNARLDITNPLAAGEYCIDVDALGDTSAPIDITVSPYDAVAALEGLYDRGDAAPPLDGSHPVTQLGPLSNRLRQDANVGGDATWYAFDVDQSGLVLVEAIAAGGNGDPWLVMYDDLGRQVAMNDDNGDGLDSLITARVNPGTYLVGVKQVGSGEQGFVRMVFERYVAAP